MYSSREHGHLAQKSDQPAILLSSRGRGWNGLQAEFLRIPAGRTHVPGSTSHRLGLHFGRSVNADCQCDGVRLKRVQKHGDFDLIPAGLDGVWEDDATCHILRLSVSPALVKSTAIELGRPEPGKVLPGFQRRDVQIEAIGWAIKTELEAAVPSDHRFAEALGKALVIRLLEIGQPVAGERAGEGQTLTPRQRRRLVDFIEGHLGSSLPLSDLASVAGLSVSHLKTLFRNTFGTSPHQYIVRRRVEHAQALILSGDLPMSQIALEAGFVDQSHMATSIRRVLGLTPGAIARMRA